MQEDISYYKEKYGDVIFYAFCQLTLGYANYKVTKITQMYKDISSFYEGGEDEWRFCGLLTSGQIKKMTDTPLKKIAYLLDTYYNNGVKAITINSENYPQKLKNIKDPPIVIYVKGAFDIKRIDDFLSIAMVGTRNCTIAGSQAGRRYAIEFCKANTIIVSGGAMGIDNVCHTGAVEVGGVTLCVLGCGIDYNYLPKQKKNRDDIQLKGALISEYLYGTQPKGYHFPQRNRIISGLCDATLVVEAGLKSGSLITAKTSYEQGRKIYAISNFGSNFDMSGCDKLIENGAKSVIAPIDILGDFTNKYKNLNLENSKKKIVFDNKYVPSSYVNELKAIRKNNAIFTLDDCKIQNIEKVNNEQIINISNNLKNSVDILEKNVYNERKENIAVAHESKKVENTPKKSTFDWSTLSNDCKAIYDILTIEPMQLDFIVEKSGVAYLKILPALTMLELNGLIKTESGNRYSKINN